MPVQTTGSMSCNEAMPPQAAMKSPVSRRFISGGQGEWIGRHVAELAGDESLPECLALARPRMGGAHLYSVAPSGQSSAAKCR
jgi:hypothetical protein